MIRIRNRYLLLTLGAVILSGGIYLFGYRTVDRAADERRDRVTSLQATLTRHQTAMTGINRMRAKLRSQDSAAWAPVRGATIMDVVALGDSLRLIAVRHGVTTLNVSHIVNELVTVQKAAADPTPRVVTFGLRLRGDLTALGEYLAWLEKQYCYGELMTLHVMEPTSGFGPPECEVALKAVLAPGV